MNPATLREQCVGVAVTVRLQLCSSNNYNRHSISALHSFMYAIHLKHGACYRRKTVILAGQDPKLRHVSAIEFQSRDTLKEQMDREHKSVSAEGCSKCVSKFKRYSFYVPLIGDI